MLCAGTLPAAALGAPPGMHEGSGTTAGAKPVRRHPIPGAWSGRLHP
ncbi:MAG: hypothetical protein L6R48_00980 [Planctomycetes bacterium]|nr:hypothetical protein [Planctomycetota bacterium]